MKKIALLLVFVLITMAFASCSTDTSSDDSDLKVEDLLGKDEDDGKGDENKPKDNIKYDCVQPMDIPKIQVSFCKF